MAGALVCPFVRLGVQKPGSLDLARFIDQDAQCLAGAVQTMIEQGRKGRFERMMFYALGHQVDSFVGDQNRPKKSPLDIPRRAVAAAGLSVAMRAPAPEERRTAQRSSTNRATIYRRDVAPTRDVLPLSRAENSRLPPAFQPRMLRPASLLLTEGAEVRRTY
jgi:hypothetical protein